MTKVQFLFHRDTIIGYVAYTEERFLFFPKKWPASSFSINFLRNKLAEHGQFPEYLNTVKVSPPKDEEMPFVFFEHHGHHFTYTEGFPAWVKRANIIGKPTHVSHFYLSLHLS
jgi:hypothetical protein